MTKAFFDAFPTVMPEDEELSSLLEHTTVTKVAVSEKRAQLRIYLDADRLIGKKDLEKVEKTLMRSLLPDKDSRQRSSSISICPVSIRRRI